MRGVPGLPRYDQLNLPVTERVSQYEQVTMPHPLLLAGVDGVLHDRREPGQDGVEQRDELRRWWRDQDVATPAAPSARER